MHCLLSLFPNCQRQTKFFLKLVFKKFTVFYLQKELLVFLFKSETYQSMVVLKSKTLKCCKNVIKKKKRIETILIIFRIIIIIIIIIIL